MVTWEQIMALAFQLESAAFRNDVTPEDGARLVRLVLQFNENITANVRKAKSTAPPTSQTG